MSQKFPEFYSGILEKIGIPRKNDCTTLSLTRRIEDVLLETVLCFVVAVEWRRSLRTCWRRRFGIPVPVCLRHASSLSVSFFQSVSMSVCRSVSHITDKPSNVLGVLVPCERKYPSGAWKQLSWSLDCRQGLEDSSRRTDQQWQRQCDNYNRK